MSMVKTNPFESYDLITSPNYNFDSSDDESNEFFGEFDLIDKIESNIDNIKVLNYKDDLGCETLNTEYKLFTLNPVLIEPENALELLRTGQWVFNESVICSIKNYLRIYLPKYIACYTHPLTKIKSGNLLIGVEDDGLVYGIPYMGVIPVDLIEKEIDDIFKKSIRIKNSNHNNSILEKYRKETKIDIIPIKKKKFNSTNTVFEEYVRKEQSMIKSYQSYLSKKKIWEDLIYKFTQKLHEMLNQPDTRNNIITFIKERSGYSKKSFNTKYSRVYHLCDFRDYYDFISELRSDFQYKSMKYETIEEMKTNPTNIFYWVTRWKDSKTSVIKSIKPKCPRISSNKNYPAFLLSQVHRMIPYWCTVNPNLNLYLIKIKVSGCIDSKTILEYMEPNGNWSESYRKVELRGPESIPLQ